MRTFVTTCVQIATCVETLFIQTYDYPFELFQRNIVHKRSVRYEDKILLHEFELRHIISFKRFVIVTGIAGQWVKFQINT